MALQRSLGKGFVVPRWKGGEEDREETHVNIDSLDKTGRDIISGLLNFCSAKGEYKNRAIESKVQGHARTPGILADLVAGYHLFLEWAETIGAVDSHVTAAQEHWEWLLSLAPDQAEQMEESDDALRWRDLLHSALACGRAYLAGPDGCAPPSHRAECGWKLKTWKDEKGKFHESWGHPEATRVGWFDGETIYLDEPETTIIVQQMATQQIHSLSQPATVKNRLVEKGWLLAGTEAGKTRYTVKSPIPLEGARRRVWRLAPGHFWSPDTADTPDAAAATRPTE